MIRLKWALRSKLHTPVRHDLTSVKATPAWINLR
jgi:hypothetical protein